MQHYIAELIGDVTSYLFHMLISADEFVIGRSIVTHLSLSLLSHNYNITGIHIVNTRVVQSIRMALS